LLELFDELDDEFTLLDELELDELDDEFTLLDELDDEFTLLELLLLELDELDDSDDVRDELEELELELLLCPLLLDELDVTDELLLDDDVTELGELLLDDDSLIPDRAKIVIDASISAPFAKSLIESADALTGSPKSGSNRYNQPSAPNAPPVAIVCDPSQYAGRVSPGVISKNPYVPIAL
jgi:hypothetical protein